MEPIRTTSGKTLRERTADLRQKRMLINRDQSQVLADKLESLALRSFELVRTIRAQANAVRLEAVEALQLVKAIRKARKLDVEL